METTEVKFVLNETLQKIDPRGPGYVYKAIQDSEDENLMVVHFEEFGKPETDVYTKKHFESGFKDGHWIEFK